MTKEQKAYCGNCIHYTRHKTGESCVKAVTFTERGTATYLHPDVVRKQYCWEKNQDNKCSDFSEKG